MSTRPRISFDKKGFCNACQWMEEKKSLNWEEREKLLKKILSEAKKNKKGNFDCLVPVSGGKDGSYVAYQLRDKYKMNILTTTVRPPLELSAGEKNLKNFIGKTDISILLNQRQLKDLVMNLVKKFYFMKSNQTYLNKFNILWRRWRS